MLTFKDAEEIAELFTFAAEEYRRSDTYMRMAYSHEKKGESELASEFSEMSRRSKDAAMIQFQLIQELLNAKGLT